MFHNIRLSAIIHIKSNHWHSVRKTAADNPHLLYINLCLFILILIVLPARKSFPDATAFPANLNCQQQSTFHAHTNLPAVPQGLGCQNGLWWCQNFNGMSYPTAELNIITPDIFCSEGFFVFLRKQLDFTDFTKISGEASRLKGIIKNTDIVKWISPWTICFFMSTSFGIIWRICSIAYQLFFI